MKHKLGVRVLSAIISLGALTLLARCTDDKRWEESVEEAPAGLVIASVIEQAQQWFVKYSGGPLSPNNGHSPEMTVAAIGPQTACPSGAMLLTHGGTQSFVRSTLSCLDTPGACSAPNVQNGLTPQPLTSQWLGETCAAGYSATPDATHQRPASQIGQTDAEVFRIGQTSFFHIATGQQHIYVGSPCVLNALQTGSAPAEPESYFVDWFRRSTDCGATWPMANATTPAWSLFRWIDNMIPKGWNFDMPHVYVDPFNKSSSGNYRAYIYGSVGTKLKGIIESNDAGATWTQRGYIGDVNHEGFQHGGSMTSTSDGTQFFFGCYGEGWPRLYYSYDRWLSYSVFDIDWYGDGASCKILGDTLLPGGVSQAGGYPYETTISRLAHTNLAADYAQVRIGFPTVVGTTQRYRFLEVGVPRKGVTTVTPYKYEVLELADSFTSYIEAGFVEPDPFDTPRGGNNGLELPDTALLWTMEGDHTTSTLMFRYRVVQGPYTYSSPRDLSANRWKYSPRVWHGHYNRPGSYYYDANAKRYNFLTVWPQGEKVLPSLLTRAEPHYNVVSIQPSINSTTLNIEKLNFGTLSSGPAVTSQGTNKLDLFWKGPSGTLIQKTYSNGWVAGTQDRGVPMVGTGFVGDPAVGSWGANRLDVFVRGTDEKLWQWWWDGTPRGWALIDNGPIKSPPAVTDAGNGVYYVFARHPDQSLRYRKYTNATGWIAGWTDLGAPVAGAPTAVNDGATVHVFIRGPDLRVWQRWTANGGTTWSAWADLGASMDSDPAVSLWGPGRVDLFGRPSGTPEITLLHRGYENGWQQSWQDLLTYRGASLDWIGNPDAVSMASKRVDVFGRSSDNLLWHVWHVSPP